MVCFLSEDWSVFSLFFFVPKNGLFLVCFFGKLWSVMILSTLYINLAVTAAMYLTVCVCVFVCLCASLPVCPVSLFECYLFG